MSLLLAIKSSVIGRFFTESVTAYSENRANGGKWWDVFNPSREAAVNLAGEVGKFGQDLHGAAMGSDAETRKKAAARASGWAAQPWTTSYAKIINSVIDFEIFGRSLKNIEWIDNARNKAVDRYTEFAEKNPLVDEAFTKNRYRNEKPAAAAAGADAATTAHDAAHGVSAEKGWSSIPYLRMPNGNDVMMFDDPNHPLLKALEAKAAASGHDLYKDGYKNANEAVISRNAIDADPQLRALVADQDAIISSRILTEGMANDQAKASQNSDKIGTEADAKVNPNKPINVPLDEVGETGVSRAQRAATLDHQYSTNMAKGMRRGMLALAAKDAMNGEWQAAGEHSLGAAQMKAWQVGTNSVVGAATAALPTLKTSVVEGILHPINTAKSLGHDILTIPRRSAGGIWDGIKSIPGGLWDGTKGALKFTKDCVTFPFRLVLHPIDTVGGIMRNTSFGQVGEALVGKASMAVGDLTGKAATTAGKEVLEKAGEEAVEKLAMEGAEKAAKLVGKTALKQGLMKTIGAFPIVGGLVAGGFGWYEYHQMKEEYAKGNCTKAQLSNLRTAIYSEVACASVSGWISDVGRAIPEFFSSDSRRTTSQGMIGSAVNIGSALIGDGDTNKTHPRVLNPNYRAYVNYAVEEAHGGPTSAPSTPKTQASHISTKLAVHG